LSAPGPVKDPRRDTVAIGVRVLGSRLPQRETSKRTGRPVRSRRLPKPAFFQADAWRRSHLVSSLPLRAKRGKERDKDSVGVNGEHTMAAPAGPRNRLLGSWPASAGAVAGRAGVRRWSRGWRCYCSTPRRPPSVGGRPATSDAGEGEGACRGAGDDAEEGGGASVCRRCAALCQPSPGTSADELRDLRPRQPASSRTSVRRRMGERERWARAHAPEWRSRGGGSAVMGEEEGPVINDGESDEK
jgi:hypothetical protein